MLLGPLSFRTASAEETTDVGAAIGALLGAGDVVSLTGDLGAGKTTLVRGAARALDVEEAVASPTFVLVREYHGTLPVYHVDVYRLDRLQDVIDLGFEDLMDGSGVVFIEWGNAVEALLPRSYLEVELEIEEGGRRVVVSARGPMWAGRWERVEAALATWGAT
ncbi:MAG TPA: tRNA (adenosine(37)-N6)-threonylcarbamoyltransferase complex ATPase subunit type 1 TsaE [Actinomycetota bacterium]|nr:tRNA (adenosine(37)-N6)-threonylcarbamoyltransferase complex ATPase subunit type 1 TsaE [Actinomycetota bacterium]